MGGDIRGLGDGPPKFEVGDGSCLRPPIFCEVLFNISRSAVIGCEAKYKIRAGKNLRFFKKVFRFLGFLGF